MGGYKGSECGKNAKDESHVTLYLENTMAEILEFRCRVHDKLDLKEILGLYQSVEWIYMACFLVQ